MKGLITRFSLLVLFTLLVSSCGAESPPTDAPPDSTYVPPPATEAPSEPEPTEVPPTEAPPTDMPVEEPAPFTVSSPAFEADGIIPERYTCLGDNVSPALEWAGVPEGAESLLLLMYDLDAGAESGASTSLGFAHWIVYNIPPSVGGYEEDVPAGETLESGGTQGSNDFAQFETPGATFPGGGAVKLIGYDGPCPGGEHRYIFELYAMDTVFNLPGGATMGEVLGVMEGHVIAQVGVVGSYDPAQ